jgi:hypothetical protein
LRDQPSGTILEPCSGRGAFVRALRSYGQVHSCEIDRGSDFFQWTEHVDWIVTNPPWSQYRPFLDHALRVADRVAFVSTLTSESNLTRSLNHPRSRLSS